MQKRIKPKVSVVITAHNYGKYIGKAIDSVLNQSFRDFELIIVNDNSSDSTGLILESYDDQRISTLNVTHGNLSKTCNSGIAASSGDYIIRLDADDWFDPHALLVLSTVLDQNRDIDMVFPDYYVTGADGVLLHEVKKIKLSDDVELMDRPALAAGAMYRRHCYDDLGGYREDISRQEDFDFWHRFVMRFVVRNISLPLMYYRQHSTSMSKGFNDRMNARRKIKSDLIDSGRDKKFSNRILILPAYSLTPSGVNVAQEPFVSNESLLSGWVKRFVKLDMFDFILIISDENISVDESCEIYIRNYEERQFGFKVESLFHNVIKHVYKSFGVAVDMAVVLHPNSPNLKVDHVDEAINTMLHKNYSAVISVVEDKSFHWRPGENGLEEVYYRFRFLRHEREMIFKETGNLYVFDASRFIISEDLFGDAVGYTELNSFEAFRIIDDYDLDTFKNSLSKSDA